MLRQITLCAIAALAGCESYNDRVQSGLGPNCVPVSCFNSDVFCGTINDGCGGTLHCGNCELPATCGGGGEANVCGCETRCDTRCGGPDGCGGTCPATCPEPLTCGGGGIQDQCGCLPECTGVCGGPDGCGGQCPENCDGFESCGGGGEPDVCGCSPNCIGRCLNADGCGGQCPDNCVSPQTCGGGGIDNVCGCNPNCTGVCGGPDGCGDVCPDACTGFESCGGGGAADVCGCTELTCNDYITAAGVQCGTFPECDEFLTCDAACANACDQRDGQCCTPIDCTGRCGPDGCGGSCGGCDAPLQCGSGGVCVQPSDPCSNDDWCLSFPWPSQLPLNDAWGSDATDVWAVGERGLLVRRVAGDWQREPNLGDANLNGVYGTAANDIWAVGDGGAVWRYDGAWNESTSNTTADLHDVWTSGARTLAAGENGTLFEFTGGVWVSVSSPATQDLNAVWGDALGAWAGGRNGELIKTDNFVVWQSIDAGTPFDVHGIWGNAADDVWFVGSGGNTNEPLLLHYNGVTFTPASAQALYNELRVEGLDGFTAVHGVAADDIFATSANLNGTGAVWRWDGASWTNDFAPDHPWGGVFAAGSSALSVGARGRLAQRDADAWTMLSAATGSSANGVAAVHGTAVDEVVAIDTSNEAWRWDGTAWLVQPLPDSEPHSVWQVSGTDIYVAGATPDGTGRSVLHWDGGAWTEIINNPSPSLRSIWAASPTDVWIVGDSSSLLRGDATAGLVSPPANQLPTGVIDVRGVFGRNANLVWIAAGTTIQQWDGSAWFSRHNAGASQVHDVWAADDTTVFAVGRGSSAFHSTDGTSFTQVVLPAFTGTQTLTRVWGTAANAVWASGEVEDGGAITPVLLFWDGSNWVQHDINTTGGLRGVFAAGNAQWTGGVEGVFVRQP